MKGVAGGGGGAPGSNFLLGSFLRRVGDGENEVIAIVMAMAMAMVMTMEARDGGVFR